MRDVIIVKANAGSEAGAKPTEELFNAMASYHEQLARVSVLADASGLHPNSMGWRVEMKGQQRSIVDGLFAEAKEAVQSFRELPGNGRPATGI